MGVTLFIVGCTHEDVTEERPKEEEVRRIGSERPAEGCCPLDDGCGNLIHDARFVLPGEPSHGLAIPTNEQ